MSSAPPLGLIGRVVGDRYRLVAPLGAGSSAQVFLATDMTLGRQVAIKMLQPALAADQRFLDHFRAEARTIASVSHPNVVVVHDSGVDEVPYLITEFLAGGSLRGMLAAGHRLTPSQALVVGLEACRGLAHAHGRGLVHRDLKPANLLFGEDGRLRIADFGLARAIAETGLTDHDSLVGTLRYVAPEQARGIVGAPADVYALALVLIEAVTGQVPLLGPDAASTLHARTSADLQAPEALGPLRQAVERAGRLDPDERVDAEEFEIALLAASEHLLPPAPLPLVGALDEAGIAEEPHEATMIAPTAAADGDSDQGKRRRRWPLLVAVLAAVALLAGGFGLAQLLSTPTSPVPPLVGNQIETLRAVAADHEWVLDEKKTRVDGSEPGEIVSIEPPPGERVEDGATLVVLVSEGNTLTDRPSDLVDRPLEEVLVELEAAGLDHSVTEVYDETIAAGNVIGTDGDIDSTLPRGEIVPLLVSKGAAPRTVPPYDPEAGYDPLAAALEDLQLVPVRDDAFSEDVPEGHIISVNPPPGAEVPRNSEVTVEVSKGPDLVSVPDLRGMTLDQAEKKLEQVGLVLGQDCCSSRGRVIGSDPGAGERVRRGTAVNLFMAR